MQNVLQISTNPGKYEIQVEHAKLEYKNNPLPLARVNTELGRFELNSQPARLRVDTYQSRKSLGHLNLTDSAAEYKNNAQSNFNEYISNVITIGRGVGDVTDGTTIGSLVRQKMTDLPRSMTVFLPAAGSVSISWQDDNLTTQYTPTEMTYEWDIKDVNFTYTRGGVSLDVLERASVDINYVGKPLYFPRSAAKAYESALAV